MQDKKFAKKKKKREKFVVVEKMKTSSARVPEICEERRRNFSKRAIQALTNCAFTMPPSQPWSESSLVESSLAVSAPFGQWTHMRVLNFTRLIAADETNMDVEYGICLLYYRDVSDTIRMLAAPHKTRQRRDN